MTREVGHHIKFQAQSEVMNKNPITNGGHEVCGPEKKAVEDPFIG